MKKRQTDAGRQKKREIQRKRDRKLDRKLVHRHRQRKIRERDIIRERE